MGANPLEEYLSELRRIRGSGAAVPETSYYPALANLLNAVGGTLKPKVHCIQHPSHEAGIPDFGLYTPDQLKGAGIEPPSGTKPARGVVEAKSAAEEVVGTTLANVLTQLADSSFERDSQTRSLVSLRSTSVARLRNAPPGVGAQVAKYWKEYRQVLVTNYRDFLLVGSDAEGKPVELEQYRLAESEAAFWTAVNYPRATAERQGEAFADFLKRVMLHAAALAAPKDVAWFIASYAREALRRIEGRHLIPQPPSPERTREKMGALAGIRSALEEALGIKFENDKGEHFFRSTLIQTLFYGIFSAWVLWTRENRNFPRGIKGSQSKTSVRSAKGLRFAQDDKNGPGGLTDESAPGPAGEGKNEWGLNAGAARFNWRLAGQYLRVPVLAELFHQLTYPAALAELRLPEVLDWTETALNRIDRAAFFEAFEERRAVQYFYEPFLEAYDPELRKQLGVWYTPHEVVRYMVARVDRVLREELKIADGLAAPNVYVLDPCCGTGSYVIEVLRQIAATLQEKGGDALTAQEIKRAAMERVYGFEILPAPFVVAHLQIGLLLRELEAPLAEGKSERAGVYLTNALTGWEPPDGAKPQMILAYPELMRERNAAEKVKQSKPILVVIGNPPYNGFAGIAVDEEADLTKAYKTAQRAPQPQGQGLNDLYVRFFRMAERKIVERGGKGIVCFISNYSWLDGLSFSGMRERYLSSFDRIWIDCLNGDKYKTGKLTPEGKPDPSIFSTEFNREGIQVGTAIALLARRERSMGAEAIGFRDLWGKEKRGQLEEEAEAGAAAEYEAIAPELKLGLSFRPGTVSADYLSWPRLPELFPVSFPGVKTSRDEVVVDIDREGLVARMEQYFDAGLADAEVAAIMPTVMTSTARFDARKTRRYLVKRGFKSSNIVRYCYRPFDIRWLYWEPDTSLLDRKREEYFPHVHEGNVWIEARQRQPMERFDRGLVVKALADNLGNGLSSFFPLLLYSGKETEMRFTEAQAGVRSNVSKALANYLDSLGVTPKEAFFHAVSVLHTQSYRAENAGSLRIDWPRVPLPGNAELSDEILRSADSAQNDGKGHLAGDSEQHRFAEVRRGPNPSTAFPKVAGGEEEREEAQAGLAQERSSGKLRKAWPEGEGENRFAEVPRHGSHCSPARDDINGRSAEELLIASAELGKEIAALLDPDTPIEGVTAGKIRSELSVIGVISREGGSTLKPEAGHLEITAGWGHGGKGSAVMPGKGRIVEREYTEMEREAMVGEQAHRRVPGAKREAVGGVNRFAEVRSAGNPRLLASAQNDKKVEAARNEIVGLLGERTIDVYLNEIGYWRNIPIKVWEYTIGGYQVIKKWLSYRERGVLGRPLRMEEARAVTEMARRIAAIILLGPRLDANYEAIKENAYKWPGGAD